MDEVENMVNWKNSIKKIGIASGKVIVKGAKIVADETKKKAVTISRKNQILDKMYPGTIRKLAYEKGLRPQSFDGGRPTDDDYRRTIMINVSLDDVIDFARRKRIPIREITEKIDKDKAEQEFKKLSENANIDEMVKDVANAIKNFKPSQNYKFELPYQAELVGWLKHKFPSAVIEKQRGSARPDIVVGGIAIEVKGPTRDKDLVTIADKCLRYSKYFRQGIIIVLFNVSVNQYRYKDWLEKLTDTFPQVIVIKK